MVLYKVKDKLLQKIIFENIPLFATNTLRIGLYSISRP